MHRTVTRIMIADPHPLILAGLRETVRTQPDFELVGTAGTGPDALRLHEQLRPEVLITDLLLAGMSGVDVIRAVRLTSPSAKSIVLTSIAAEENIFQALQAGARGYLLKETSAETLLDCVRAVAAGRRYLTPSVAATLANRFDSEQLSQREKQVLALVADGRCNKHISRDIGITEGTTKFHLNNIFGKLGVNSRSAAINVALKRGLIRI